MAKNSVADLLSVGSLFTTQAERDEAQRETVRDIPLEEISDFPNHPLQIALRPAVELSYLTEKEQQDLFEIMESEDCTPSHAQAIKMRQFSQEGRLDANVLLSIMQEEKSNRYSKRPQRWSWLRSQFYPCCRRLRLQRRETWVRSPLPVPTIRQEM